MGDDLELPDEIYGFGSWLLWLTAIRATELVDQVYEVGPARPSRKYGMVNGHHVPTPALIAWLLTAAEFNIPVADLADRSGEVDDRHKVLRTLVSRAVSGEPRLFRATWLRSLAALCGFTARDLELLLLSRDDDRCDVEPAALRTVIERSLRRTGPGAAAGADAGGTATATRTLPRDVASFVGRVPQLRRLMTAADAALNSSGAVSVCAVSGMAGAGKTTLAIHAAHVLAPRFPDGQIFLSLHGYTAGQRPLEAAEALTSLLMTAGVNARQIPQGLEPRMRLWRDLLAGKRILLVLDDASGNEQIRPLLPGTPGNLVLVTSRRRLTALEDTAAISLDSLPPEEAAELFSELSSRPGLDARDVAEVARLCGYLPLAVGMLARQLQHHPAWSAADLAADLAAARDRLDLITAENRSVAAAFELSYRELPPDQQRFFRRLGLHPGPDIDIRAAASLDDIDPGTARRNLNALYDHCLLLETAHGRYRFHDLIRQYASTLAATDSAADCGAARNRLFGFYLRATRAASTHLTRRTAGSAPARTPAARPGIPDLATQRDATRWMEAERLNLEAIAAYASAHGPSEYAIAIPAAMHPFLLTRGYLDQGLRLHRGAVSAAADSGDRQAQTRALTELGELQRRLASFADATESQAGALRLSRETGDRLSEASALTQLGWLQYLTDDYRAAAGTLAQALGVYRDAADQLGEADALTHLGYVHYVTDDYPAATASLTEALSLFRNIGDGQGEAGALNYLAVVHTETGRYRQAIACFRSALTLSLASGDRSAEATFRTGLGRVQCLTGDNDAAIANLAKAADVHNAIGNGLGEASALNYLGQAQRHAGNLPAASASQHKAIDLYQAKGSRLGEADARMELGTIQKQAGNLPQAAAILDQALELYRDLGYRLGQAEALNNIGDLLLAASEPAQARARYQQALALAFNLTAPPTQAHSLEGVGRSYLADGQPACAMAPFRQALDIYQQLGSSRATQAQEALRLAMNDKR
jgi:tetratricopeptide (TPR) repeat protein